MYWTGQLLALVAGLIGVTAVRTWIRTRWPKLHLDLALIVLLLVGIVISAVMHMQETKKSSELERKANIISSLEMRVWLGEITEKRPISELQTSPGIQNAVALFTKDKTRFRFVTDFQFSYQQATPTLRRAFFTYKPEEPVAILGRNIKFLENMDKFAFNYSDFLKPIGFKSPNKGNVISISVLLNGVEVVSLNNVPIKAGSLLSGQLVLDVSPAFKDIATKYSRQLEARENG